MPIFSTTITYAKCTETHAFTKTSTSSLLLHYRGSSTPGTQSPDLAAGCILIQLCFTAFTGLASVDLLRFSSSFSHSALPELLSIHVDASVVQTVIDA
jgi:hypothetical protein